MQLPGGTALRTTLGDGSHYDVCAQCGGNCGQCGWSVGAGHPPSMDALIAILNGKPPPGLKPAAAPPGPGPLGRLAAALKRLAGRGKA